MGGRKKNKGILKNLLRSVTTGFICAGLLCSTAFAAGDEETVTLTIDAMPHAEVALAVGRTEVDYSNFENDLKAALGAKGLPSNQVSFVEVDANAVASKDSFAWWTFDHTTGSSVSVNNTTHQYLFGVNNITSQYTNDYNSKTNHIETSNNGTTMSFYGYGSSAFKDFKFLPNDQATKKTIEFTLTEQQAYDAMDGYGFLINSSITGNMDTASPNNQVINGYLVFFQYTGSVGQSMKLIKLSNVSTYALCHASGSSYSSSFNNLSSVGSSIIFGGGSASLVANASTTYGNYKYRKVKIEVMPTYVKVWYNGGANAAILSTELTEANAVSWVQNSATVKELQLDKSFSKDSDGTHRGGYGVLSSYRSHSCNGLTNFTLSNLRMDSEYVRSLTEVVREPSWSADKVSFLVNLNEDHIEDFSEVYTVAEIINRLAADDIAYIGWCGTTNATDSQAFVNSLAPGSGTVNMDLSANNDGTNAYSKASYNKQIAAIAQIIYERLQKQTNVGGTHKFLTTEKFRFNPVGTTLNDGKWSVGYNSGDISKNETENFALCKNGATNYPDLSQASFDNKGYYEVYYNGDYDTPKARIKIHEAPVAQLTATASASGITITNKSYDSEFITDTNTIAGANGSEAYGIDSSKTVIKYKNVTAGGEYTTTAPTTVNAGDIWLVSLSVTDIDGEESNTVVQVTYTANTPGTPAPPTKPYSQVSVSKNTYIKNVDTNVTVTDGSYSPDGSTNYTTTIKITSTSLASAITKTINYAEQAASSIWEIALSGLNKGSYQVSLYASPNNDTTPGKTYTSPTVSRTFKVVDGYLISYDANGGLNAPSNTYKIENETFIIASSAPTNPDTTKVFGGWRGSDGKTYQPGNEYKSNQALTLTAIWLTKIEYSATASYTTEYDGNDHGIAISFTAPVDGAGANVQYKYSAGGSYGSKQNLINPGVYTIYFKISAPGYQTVEGQRLVTIQATNPGLTLTDQTVNYDGSNKRIDTLVLTGASENDKSNGDLTYTYYTDSECTTKTGTEQGAATEGGAPSKAGTYYVKVSITASTDNKYNAFTSNAAKFVIRDYKVTFESTYGTKPEDITAVTYNTAIEDPGQMTDPDHIFLGWFKDQELTGSAWDFDTDKVTDDITLYAGWKAKASYPVRWIDEDGEEHFGTLEEALDALLPYTPDPTKPNKPSIIVQNDTQWPGTETEYEIPEGFVIETAPGAKLTIPEDITIKNKGTLIGVTVKGTVEGGIISGTSTNTGTIKGATITGTIINKGGVITDATISGTVENKDGVIKDATITEDGKVNEGELAGNIINAGSIDVDKITGKVTNNGGLVISDDTIKVAEKTEGQVKDGAVVTNIPTDVNRNENVEVTVSSGKVIVSVEASSNISSNVVLNDVSSVINSTLTEEEIESVENGQKIRIKLEVDDMGDKTNTPEEKQIIEAVVAENAGYSFVTNFDISVFKKIGAEAWTKVPELNGKIRVSFAIPDSIKQPGAKYMVVRIHDGIPEVLADLDDDEDTITIETDKFSTYSILRSEVKAPDTGDTGNLLLYGILMLISAIVILASRLVKAEQKSLKEQ